MCYDARGMGASPQNICLVLLKHNCNFWWLAAFLIGRTVCMSRRAFGNLLLACSVWLTDKLVLYFLDTAASSSKRWPPSNAKGASWINLWSRSASRRVQLMMLMNAKPATMLMRVSIACRGMEQTSQIEHLCPWRTRSHSCKRELI